MKTPIVTEHEKELLGEKIGAAAVSGDFQYAKLLLNIFEQVLKARTFERGVPNDSHTSRYILH